jgi:hypothetical protein
LFHKHSKRINIFICASKLKCMKFSFICNFH